MAIDRKSEFVQYIRSLKIGTAAKSNYLRFVQRIESHVSADLNEDTVRSEDDVWRLGAEFIKNFSVANPHSRWARSQFPVHARGAIRLYLKFLQSLELRVTRRERDHLAQDLSEIMSRRGATATTKQTLIQARLGQGEFRTNVLNLWDNQCAVTGSCTREAIRASHIIPWRDSEEQQRLDPANGLPLVANLDALFDAGLISFEDSGRILVSSKLSRQERAIYNLSERRLRKKPHPKVAVYLRQHRENYFQA